MQTCFLALFFHNNKVFLTLDQCSLTPVNFILTLENLGPRVNDSWDSYPSENPVHVRKQSFCGTHEIIGRCSGHHSIFGLMFKTMLNSIQLEQKIH